MIETKRNIVATSPVRVYEKTFQRLKRLQHEEWEKTGAEPTYAELIERGVTSYLLQATADSVESQAVKSPSEKNISKSGYINRQCDKSDSTVHKPEAVEVLLRMAEAILMSEHPASVALGWNVSTFYSAIRAWLERREKHGDREYSKFDLAELPATEAERAALRDHILQEAEDLVEQTRRLQSGGGEGHSPPTKSGGSVRKQRRA